MCASMNPRSRRLALTLIAAGASLLLNLVPYGPLAAFNPGRIFSLPVAILLGPWYGLLAALGGAAAYLNPDAPSRPILYVLEALAIAFAARRGRSPVLTAALYWSVVAIAFISSPAFFGSAFAVYQGPLAWTYALQRNLTLMVAVLVAKLIVIAVRRHPVSGAPDGTTPHSLRKDSYDSFELAALLPVLILSVVTSQILAARQQSDGSNQLVEEAASVRDRVDQYLVSHTKAVSTLAESLRLVGDDPQRRRDLLQQFAKTYDQFSTVSSFDERGRLREAVPEEPPTSPLWTIGIGDRAYFKEAMRTGQPQVSGILMARSSLRRAVLTLVTPYTDGQGRMVGAGLGVLDLPRLQQFVDRYRGNENVAVTIVDRQGMVISASPGSGREVLQNLAGDPLVQGGATASDVAYQYDAQGERGIQVAAVATLPTAGWHVYVEQPLVTMQLQSARFYVITFALIGLGLAGTMLAARRFSRFVTRPLEELTTIVGNVSVRQSAGALLVVINDILDFSKIEAGTLHIEAIAFSLRTMVEDTVRPLALKAHQKGLELLIDVAPGVPDTLVGDPSRLRQVLVNLLGNAITFTQKGEVVVRVEAGAPAGERVPLRFTVRDTGIGIPLVKQRDIFGAFTQADGSTTRRYGGTDLGLTVSTQLVGLMGGAIEVESVPGQGSAFHVSLALALSAEPVAGRVPLHREALAGIHVLVVDDNDTNRRILCETLAGWGMTVVATPTGAATLAAAARPATPFRCVLLDHHLPDMTGDTLAAALRRDPQYTSTPMLILASADRPREPIAHDEAITGHVVKPVGQIALFEALSRLLGSDHCADRPPAAPAIVPAHAARALRVLVAEDNPVNRRLAQHLLERRGHLAHLVENGRQAVDAIAAAEFDLVLMDLEMPEMDGFEATAAIRASERQTGAGDASAPRPRLPIVALTAHAMRGDHQRCLDAGMDGYVSKPIKPVELFDVIDRVIAASGRQHAAPTA